MFFDPYYLIVVMLPAMLIIGFAQWRVRSAYGKYSKIANMQGISGWRAAQMLLSNSGLSHVVVEGVPGELTDHYDPTKKVLRLSQGVSNQASVASLGIVAHEVGHAVQDATGYVPLRIRASLVPVANLGSGLGPWLIIGGILLGLFELAFLGVIFFSAAVLFSLITLPVELDASRRAKAMLLNSGLVTTVERDGAGQVLSAAALTYVAALLVAVIQLLYFVLRLQGMNRD